MKNRNASGSQKTVFASFVSAAASIGLVAALAAPAQAAETVTTFNPFSINGGFTVVAQGNAILSNGEIEGSIAVTGSVSSAKSSAYPVRHVSAGMADYTVPVVDGDPVRILAGSFVGTGSFDQTNEGAAAGSNEANAISKFVSVDNLSASSRGSNFTRLRNSESAGGEDGVFDLKPLAFTNEAGALARVKTEQSTVESYLGNVTSHVAATNACLSSLYTNADLHNDLTVEDQGGMVFPSGAVTDRPNVVDYSAIAGKTIKSDRLAGWKPTAQAPLIIKVPAGTSEISKVTFEGWNSSAGADQVLSRYIMLDLSAVTGPVKIDGFEMGSIWAPGIDLNFDSNTTTNGQWFAGNVTAAGAGEIHHHSFLGQLKCVVDEDGGTSDGGTTDGGTSDGGTSDGGTTDGGTSDGGTTDGGTSDGGTTDGGTSDGGTSDGGTTDGGTSDGGTTDGGTSDGGTSDGGTTDGGTTDGGTSDGGTTDGGTTDAANNGSEAGTTDGGTTDGGTTDAANNGSEAGQAGGDSDDLAQTGFSGTLAAVVAGLMLIAGVGAVVFSRKAAQN